MISSVASAWGGIPHVVSTVRMGMVPKQAKLLSKYACKLGTLSIANSYTGLRAWRIPQDKGRVVHNGFDWNRVTPSYTNRSTGNKAYRVLMTASMSPLKDWNAFLSVAKYLSGDSLDIVFYGFGDGYCRENILTLATNLLASKKIFLPGRTLNPLQECMNADVGVMLSTFGEGISNSIMEYMACGLPVICSGAGGNAELVIDGITGFLVEPDNSPEQIAEKILWLKNNPDKARTMGLTGKERIKKHFSTEKMVEAYLKIYQEAMAMHDL